MRKKRWPVITLFATGILLILGAASLYLYNRWDDNRAYDMSTQIADIFMEKLTAKDEPVTAEASAAAQAPAVEAPCEEPYFVIDGNSYIGVIEIPALNIRLPVLSDWDAGKMKLSPCRYSGSIKGGNLVILAHNYSRFFGRLKTLTTGETVRFTDARGVVSTYAVAELLTLSPTSINEMKHSGYPLSLFTCTYGGQFRVTVRCAALGEDGSNSSG